MSISQLAKSIKESPTLKMNEIAKQMVARGEAVIHLGGGEPKSKVPMDALIASSTKLNSMEINYTPPDGTPEMKKAIIRYMEENYSKSVPTDNIIVSNGAKQSASILLQAILDPQDEVICLAPYWVSYPDMVKIAYGVPVAVKPEDGSFHPRMQDIEQAVSPHTKAIIVNSPGNPSGVLFSKEFIADIVAFCEKKGIYLIMDDIYHKLVFDGLKAVSCYEFTKKNLDDSKIVVINGVSKLYAMTGYRIGWTIADSRIVQAMIKIQEQTTSCPSALLQAGAVGALNGMQNSVEALRLRLENNRNVMMTELGTFSGIKVIKPSGTFYCFPDFSAYMKDSEKLSNYLLEKVKVVTVLGREFGMEGHLRLSFCGSIKDIKEGVARIKWALDPNAPNEIFIGDRKLVRDWQ
jgi:aspartate/methionine/tyrosine aminotransferase